MSDRCDFSMPNLAVAGGQPPTRESGGSWKRSNTTMQGLQETIKEDQNELIYHRNNYFLLRKGNFLRRYALMWYLLMW